VLGPIIGYFFDLPVVVDDVVVVLLVVVTTADLDVDEPIAVYLLFYFFYRLCLLRLLLYLL
jgi:hypothetical protein